ncbi:hypothetical protein RB195_013523 [Necator americanus]|uniref:Uncharacterized protein n=1 Tax=Necator americanus TaxID=51031 RepID=A0ABR1DWA5_NECAM
MRLAPKLKTMAAQPLRVIRIMATYLVRPPRTERPHKSHNKRHALRNNNCRTPQLEPYSGATQEKKTLLSKEDFTVHSKQPEDLLIEFLLR